MRRNLPFWLKKKHTHTQGQEQLCLIKLKTLNLRLLYDMLAKLSSVFRHHTNLCSHTHSMVLKCSKASHNKLYPTTMNRRCWIFGPFFFHFFIFCRIWKRKKSWKSCRLTLTPLPIISDHYNMKSKKKQNSVSICTCAHKKCSVPVFAFALFHFVAASN